MWKRFISVGPSISEQIMKIFPHVMILKLWLLFLDATVKLKNLSLLIDQITADFAPVQIPGC